MTIWVLAICARSWWKGEEGSGEIGACGVAPVYVLIQLGGKHQRLAENGVWPARAGPAGPGIGGGHGHGHGRARVPTSLAENFVVRAPPSAECPGEEEGLGVCFGRGVFLGGGGGKKEVWEGGACC